MNNISKFLIIFLLFVLSPVNAYSAEIIQINNSKNVLVGDQIRNLTIRLSCGDVNDNDELKAMALLKKEFPRGSKVKIKPLGYKDNLLIAKVFNINGTKEMSDLLIAKNLTKQDCLN